MAGNFNKNVNDELMSFVNENVEVFEENYQSKFLKVFIEDRNNWAQQMMDIIFPEYFDGFHKILVDHEINYFKKYRIAADYDDLRQIINDREKDEITKQQLYGTIEKIRHLELEHVKKDAIKERAYSYFKSRKMKNTLIELALDWKKNTFDSMKSKLEDALKAGEAKESGHKYFQEIEKRLKKDFRNPIPILKGFDPFIGGGPAGGELVIFMAGPGVGKSMMLVRAACEALKMGKKVVYYTLELSKEVVGQRFDACLNGIHLKNVWDFKEYIKEKSDELYEMGANLIIEHYGDGEASINTLYSHLDFIKSNEGFVPDMVIVDYADNMKPLTSHKDLRHDIVGIYRNLRALGFEFGIPVISASQAGRLGAGKSELGLENLAEAYAKANIADIVLSVGRNPEQLRDNKATLSILKNRNGSTGSSFELDFYLPTVQIEMAQIPNYSMEEKRILVGIESKKAKIEDMKSQDELLKKFVKKDISEVLNNQNANI